jgi:hypothetical protein
VSVAAQRFAAELDDDAAEEPAALDAVLLAQCAEVFVKMAVGQYTGENPPPDVSDLKAARETVTNMTASLLEEGALTGIQ